MNEIELKARELLAEMARGFGQPEYAYHIGCGGVLDKGDRKLIAPIIAALTSQWQPIESAPKDGTPVLVDHPAWHSRVLPGEWDENLSAWRVDGFGFPATQPSKWHPMPAPPETP